MPEQIGRQHGSLGSARKKNDGIEHAYRGSVAAVCAEGQVW
jgi:hypothetical protein